MNPMAELDAVTSLRAGIVDGPAEDKVEGIRFADSDKETGGSPLEGGGAALCIGISPMPSEIPIDAHHFL